MTQNQRQYSQPTGITAVVDSWPYSLHEIERTVYSAANIAEQITLVLPDLVSPYTEEHFVGLPANVVRIPFYGNFTTVRNLAMEHVRTPWLLLLFGNEVFVAADKDMLLGALNERSRPGFRVTVLTSDDRRVLAHPVRLLPSFDQVRFVGRIWPEVSGSLIEFGTPLRDLAVRVYREQDRSTTATATATLKAQLTRAVATNPRDGRPQVALAMVSWAEHRYSDAHRRLAALPRDVAGEPRLIAESLAAWLWVEQGNYDKGRAAAAELVRLHPDRADGWAILGEASLAAKSYSEAEHAFHRAVSVGEVPVPHLAPGYASYAARLKAARAEIADRRILPGLAHLLAIMEEYPGYRPAWQEVLSHLRGMPPEDVYAAMATVVAPFKIRQFFSRLDRPTEDEWRMVEWLGRQ